ncbi:MAG TPA: 3-phosphoserine/phosphohydroxythreonine transaminase [Gemmatimonadales bacterium]|jgi:phosphoserine aminotransferase|nr:3-phosphoserine/phosphohydroxythreonine transaminase [Gemmatimonadales bacterium]
MPTDRIHNFSAGPAALPESVLRKAQEAIWNVAGSGIGIMEHSHRGKVFDRIIAEAEQACRSLADIPDNYRVLFLQGGASLQFAMVPMNLLRSDRIADYLVTGVWSQKAVKEAKPVGKVHIAASSESTNFDRIPQTSEIRYSSNPVYVHITTNNTIFGTQWPTEPPVPAGVPLVADTSSDMYSRPIDIRKYGIIYAGAQKNLGPSGVVLVIIRDDLIEAGAKDLPTMLQYRTHAAENSLYNTPPTFGIYFMGEVFKWIQSQGGLAAMAEHNQSKARLLYDYLDSSEFFRGTAQPDSRSLMNVCFRAPTEELEAKFISEATKRGLDGLKGHRSVGGMRASIYNACPRQAVEDLVKFMKEFERSNRATAART